MALSFDTITIAGRERDVLTLSGTDATRKFILKDSITPIDLDVFEKIDAEGTGDTLEDKFGAWVLSNGRTALETFAKSIKTFASFNAGSILAKAQGMTPREVAALIVASGGSVPTPDPEDTPDP